MRKQPWLTNRALFGHPSANQIREPRLSFEHYWCELLHTRHLSCQISYAHIVISCVVIGCPSQGDKDFTPAAAQVAHQKPVPAVQKLPTSHHFNQHIHQPRKWALHNSRPPGPPAQGPGPTTTPNTCSGARDLLPSSIPYAPLTSVPASVLFPPVSWHAFLFLFLPVDHCNTKKLKAPLQITDQKHVNYVHSWGDAWAVLVCFNE